MTPNPKALLIPAPAMQLEQFRPYFPIGLYSIREYAARFGLDIHIPDLANSGFSPSPTSTPEMGDAILSLFNPADYEIIGLSTLSPTFTITLYLAETIKRLNPRAIIVFGGPHSSMLPLETLADFPFVDAVVVGEGEVTFTEMLAHFNGSATGWAGIPGVMIRNAPSRKRELLPDLDLLPPLQYNADPYKVNGVHYLRIEALRGCYARCKFCAATRFWECKIRRKSPSRLLAEMNELSALNQLTTFQMIGDNFSFPLESCREICQAMIREKSCYEWVCALRIGDLAPQDLELMQAAGCSFISVGVESASQDTLRRIGKNIDLSKTISMIQTLSLSVDPQIFDIRGCKPA